MMQVIECVGHPRDLGFAQGVALRREVTRKVEEEGLPLSRSRWASLHPYVKGPIRGKGSFREMIRHYTHLAERVDGLSRGADLPVDSIYPLQGSGEAKEAQAVALFGARPTGETAASLIRGLSGPDWVVRKSRPEVGFASIELTQAWSVSSAAGINEASLAACMVPDGGSSQFEGDAYPPAQLLVQECLQRFQDIEAAIDWCSHRPSSGEASLLLVDGSGGRALVAFQGKEVQVTRNPAGVYGVSSPEPLVEALGESVASPSGLDEKLLSQVLVQQSARGYVRLCCDGPRFEVQNITGPEEALLSGTRFDPLEAAPSVKSSTLLLGSS